MNRMYSDGVVILDLDYLIAATMADCGGHWMLDVLPGLGAEGKALTLVYPSQGERARAFLAMRQCFEDQPRSSPRPDHA